MPVYKSGYNSKPTISIYDKDGSINDKELDPEIKVGAIYKIVDVEKGVNGQKIYVLCQTSGEIIKNNQDNVISLVDNGYVINAWLRHRKSSKLDSFNRYKNVEIVVTNLDSIKGAPPNIESKIVPGKDQTIERLKSFEIIARYNRKESLLGRKQNLEFDILILMGIKEKSQDILQLKLLWYVLENLAKMDDFNKGLYNQIHKELINLGVYSD